MGQQQSITSTVSVGVTTQLCARMNSGIPEYCVVKYTDRVAYS